ncbi:MAG: cyclic 2,3-diphosphoglycerate synthase [Anaerolineae bacterium]|nr:cyclic 2,3-diphosphoglycerate synthase [Anaerolineae bacterium]MDW8101052.1 cyclic 2,3-diphosphoglycerate synthase [Anaerolineae bacterium]
MTRDAARPIRVLIMGAAGRDFHNFNVCFRDDPRYLVVAFTAAQIPNIEGRRYPPQLAGDRYPEGIPIYAEADLERLICELDVDQVVFAYSDVSHEYVMHCASRALAAGADFRLMGPKMTMLHARRPVVAVCAARTGSGKSQTTRRVCDVLRAHGQRVVVVRHPMPYGDLARQACQRFATYADLDVHQCTIEEREEYEPHLSRNIVVYAGVDYAQILHQAEQEADVIVWDGGNNDLPFYRPDLHIVVVDPHRAGHELTYHPGEANVRLADVIIINKVDTADLEPIARVRENVRAVNPAAQIVEAASPIFLEDPQAIRGKRVLVIEDGPTLTHGEMAYGAGVVAARRFGAAELVDPRPYAVGSIVETYRKYPAIGPVLPAMGYGQVQIAELQETIRRVPCDLVLVATPIDLRRVIHICQPIQRVRYELQEIGQPTLEQIIGRWLAALKRERLGR